MFAECHGPGFLNGNLNAVCEGFQRTAGHMMEKFTSAGRFRLEVNSSSGTKTIRSLHESLRAGYTMPPADDRASAGYRPIPDWSSEVGH